MTEGHRGGPNLTQEQRDWAEERLCCDPTETNRAVASALEAEFDRPTDQTTIANIRRQLGLPSSKDARKWKQKVPRNWRKEAETLTSRILLPSVERLGFHDDRGRKPVGPRCLETSQGFFRCSFGDGVVDWVWVDDEERQLLTAIVRGRVIHSKANDLLEALDGLRKDVAEYVGKVSWHLFACSEGVLPTLSDGRTLATYVHVRDLIEVRCEDPPGDLLATEAFWIYDRSIKLTEAVSALKRDLRGTLGI